MKLLIRQLSNFKSFSSSKFVVSKLFFGFISSRIFFQSCRQVCRMYHDSSLFTALLYTASFEMKSFKRSFFTFGILHKKLFSSEMWYSFTFSTVKYSDIKLSQKRKYFRKYLLPYWCSGIKQQIETEQRVHTCYQRLISRNTYSRSITAWNAIRLFLGNQGPTPVDGYYCSKWFSRRLWTTGYNLMADAIPH